jgi:hypothetical protein
LAKIRMQPSSAAGPTTQPDTHAIDMITTR